MSISNEQVLAFVKKNPISIGCCVLSLFLAGFIYYRSDLLPAAHDILDEKAKEGEKLAANVKYSNQLKEQLDELLAAGKAIDARLINVSQQADNVGYFYKLEADTNTRLLNLAQVTTATRVGNVKTAFSPIAFNVNVQGSYPQTLDFLHRLETGQHYCRVLNATFAKVGVEGDLIALNLNLELLGQK